MKRVVITGAGTINALGHDVPATLEAMRDLGNTVLVIEHNMDIIKTADWIIDLGPEGGYKGGRLIATGTPEQVADNPDSFTGHYLKRILNSNHDKKATG